LLRIWKAHYLDGQPLDEYAASTGHDLAAAGADYRDLLTELSDAALAVRRACQLPQ
jgi:hypothetical protein